MPSGAKKHHKSTEPEKSLDGQNAFLSFFFFASKLRDSFTIVFKTAAFSLSSAPSHHFFTTLKSHEVV